METPLNEVRIFPCCPVNFESDLKEGIRGVLRRHDFLDQRRPGVPLLQDSVAVAEQSGLFGLDGFHERAHVLNLSDLLEALVGQLNRSAMKGSEAGDQARDSAGYGICEGGSSVQCGGSRVGNFGIRVQYPQFIQTLLNFGV